MLKKKARHILPDGGFDDESHGILIRKKSPDVLTNPVVNVWYIYMLIYP